MMHAASPEGIHTAMLSLAHTAPDLRFDRTVGRDRFRLDPANAPPEVGGGHGALPWVNFSEIVAVLPS